MNRIAALTMAIVLLFVAPSSSSAQGIRLTKILPRAAEIIDIVCELKNDSKSLTRKAVDMGIDIGVSQTSVPIAVSIASNAGMTASTGTAISSLSGAAATSATLAAIGSPASAALAAVGITFAPAVAGGFIVAGAAAGAAYGTKKLIDRFSE